jgi:RNA polymerase sigma-70 factor (ECF subfamily)
MGMKQEVGIVTTSPAVTLPADESDLVARARGGDKAAIRTIVRQNNRRLFRVARSILKDEWEAEDAVQEAYVRAFRRLGDFEGRSKLATWLTRIVVNEALMRLRRPAHVSDLIWWCYRRFASIGCQRISCTHISLLHSSS